MYRLIIVHCGEEEWAAEVENTIRTVMDGLGVPNSKLSRVDPSAMDRTNPTTIVYLANSAAAQDPNVDTILQGAVAAAHSVMPIHRRNQNPATVMPASMRRLNAADWTTAPTRVALSILRGMGIAEDVRRLFLSYRRAETSKFALQLHTALSNRGYDVFLDRFSVPWGVDFQRRIEIDLSDKAFVLFLESAGVGESQWVEEEVAYALSHRISHLALTMPETEEHQRFATIDDAFRFQLNSHELDDGELTDEALQRVLDEIEMRYARLMRRRRDQIVGTLTELIADLGYHVTVAGDWALLAEHDQLPTTVYFTTPRAPSPRDLYFADQLRAPLMSPEHPSIAAVVVHMADDLEDEARSLVEWVGRGCGLSTQLMDGSGLHG